MDSVYIFSLNMYNMYVILTRIPFNVTFLGFCNEGNIVICSSTPAMYTGGSTAILKSIRSCRAALDGSTILQKSWKGTII